MIKKFINDWSYIVDEMIDGFVEAFPYFYEKHSAVNGVLYRNRRRNKVALVTGGGSGHEPLFIGFVGKGLADAAVCGNLYNAPDPDSIYQTAKSVESGKGVLFLYGTYPGDRINFDIAEEMLNAEGIVTKHVCVHDDMTSAPETRKNERRGISGDVFMLRIAGAACDADLDINEIVKLLENANEKIWSIGAAIKGKRTGYQNKKRNSNSDETDYIEYGIGLHSGRGILLMKLQPVDQLVTTMYSKFMDEADLEKGDEVCVLVNGFGFISLMELFIVYRKLKKLLLGDGIQIYDADVNNYCSSYESEGFSVTLFKIGDELKKYYNASCYSPYFHHKFVLQNNNLQTTSKESLSSKNMDKIASHLYIPVMKGSEDLFELDVLLLRDMMIHVADRLIEAGEYLSELDSMIGDGDHGIYISSGMKKAKQRLMDLTEDNQPYDVYQIIGKTMFLVGGASGVFFGSMYMAAAESVKGKSRIHVMDFADMWNAALSAVIEKGGAHRGGKTLIDALAPGVDALMNSADKNFLEAIKVSEKAAKQGMLDTKSMIAEFGRGKFLLDRTLGFQDAGATTVWITFKSMREYLDKAI